MSPATLTTPTRLALVDAAALVFLLTLGFCYLWWDSGSPHLGAETVQALLLATAACASIVFWRVRSAYRAGPVSISRAVLEGCAGTAACFLAVSAVAAGLKLLAGSLTFEDVFVIPEVVWEQVVLGPVMVTSFGGGLAGVLWSANKYALERFEWLSSDI
jgi:hypothetical protein